ncbi:MAG: hypothetical protein ACFFCZ_15105 [Promethearchaeota archaeon]
MPYFFIKVVVLGDPSINKRKLLRPFIDKYKWPKHFPTPLSTDLYLLPSFIKMLEDVELKMIFFIPRFAVGELWKKEFYERSSAVIFFYDMSSIFTLQYLSNVINDINQFIPPPKPKILCGIKTTSDNEASILNEAETLAQKYSFVSYEVDQGDLSQIEQVILDLANNVVKSLPNLQES